MACALIKEKTFFCNTTHLSHKKLLEFEIRPTFLLADTNRRSRIISIGIRRGAVDGKKFISFQAFHSNSDYKNLMNAIADQPQKDSV